MSDSSIKSLSWRPPLLADWLAVNTAQPRWLLEGLLPADAKVLISGKAKRAYKSWLTFAMAMSVATGKTIGPFIPSDKNGLPVLILAAEGGRGKTADRWHYLKHGLNIDLTNAPIYFSHRESILLDAAMWEKRVCDLTKEVAIKFVIVDPLVMFMRGDENDVQAVAAVMRVLGKISEQGATVMFVHHLRKTSAQKTIYTHPDEDIRGSSAIQGFYDTHFALRQRSEKQKHNELHIINKDDEEKYFHISWKIDAKLATATFDMHPVDEPGELSPGFAAWLCEKLQPAMKYNAQDLAGLWDMPVDEAKGLALSLVQAKMLEKEKRSYYLAG